MRSRVSVSVTSSFSSSILSAGSMLSWNCLKRLVWPSLSVVQMKRVIRSSILLFGGQGDGYLGDTWTFAGGAWRSVCGADDAGLCSCGPCPRAYHGMAYDVARAQSLPVMSLRARITRISAGVFPAARAARIQPADALRR